MDSPAYTPEEIALRDHFAGQAIPALIALSAEDKLIKFVGETTGQCVARSAFEIADAMLAERSRPDAG